MFWVVIAIEAYALQRAALRGGDCGLHRCENTACMAPFFEEVERLGRLLSSKQSEPAVCCPICFTPLNIMYIVL